MSAPDLDAVKAMLVKALDDTRYRSADRTLAEGDWYGEVCPVSNGLFGFHRQAIGVDLDKLAAIVSEWFDPSFHQETAYFHADEVHFSELGTPCVVRLTNPVPATAEHYVSALIKAEREGGDVQ